MKFNEIIEINSNQLFNGAVDLDWYLKNNEKSKEVATSYFFHGPKNHSGKSSTENKKLTDTITMSAQIVKDVSTPGSKMELAIAGYGAGKSHFSVMISHLLNSDSNTKKNIFDNIAFIDSKKSTSIENTLQKDNRPVLIIPINGMRNCNLTEEFIRVTKLSLKKDSQSISFFNKFNSKYDDLSYLVKIHKNQGLMLDILKSCGCDTFNNFEERMSNWDDAFYNSIIHEFHKNGERATKGSTSTAEIKEIIDEIYKNNCGEDNYYKSMLIIFDEFGKYMMFAAEQETIAGKGIMQSLFAGINNLRDDSITLLAFSQLDLKAYQNTTNINNENIENNKNRYITRFNDAKRYYLSVNFETLISNLIKIKQASYLPVVNSLDLQRKKNFFNQIFPSSMSYDIWSNINEFEKYFIACWPLDSFTLWVLVYLSSVNTILQQRSSLNILKDCFEFYKNKEVSYGFIISSVDLFNAGLGLEFSNSETSMQSQSQITNDYYGILEKYNNRLSDEEIKVLQAIVISSKISAVTNNFKEANKLIYFLTFIKETEVERIINNLVQKYNMIQEGLNNLYEINSDVPSQKEYRKTFAQRLDVLKKTLVIKDKPKYARDFINSAFFDTEKDNFFKVIEPTFGLNNDVKTFEWRFMPEYIVCINAIEEIKNFINKIKWNDHSNLLSPKGVILYVIINEEDELNNLEEEIQNIIIEKGKKFGFVLPLIIVLLPDYKSMIANSSILYEVAKQFTPEEQVKFGPYLIKDKNKCKSNIIDTIEKANNSNIIITGLDKQPKKRTKVANLLFETIYPRIISFPVDGFQTIQNRGVNEILNLINIMLYKPTKEYVGNKLTSIQMKRCLFLMEVKWGFFDSNGYVKESCNNNSINRLFEEFDKSIEIHNRINPFNIFITISSSPYGLNPVGALLLTFLYYFARTSKLRCVKNEDIFDIQTIKVDKNFLKPTSKFFTINDLKDMSFVKTVSDDQLWIDLLDKWENTDSITQIIEYNKESNRLLTKLNIQLPNSLNNKQYDCKKKYEKAFAKFLDYTSLIEKSIPSIENKASRGSIFSLYQSLANFKSTLDRIMYNKAEWETLQVKKIENFIQFYKTIYLVDKFGSWLKENSLFVSSKLQHNKNREKYKNLLSYFETLEISDYAKKLKEELNFDDLYIKHLYEYENIVLEYNSEISLIRKEINPVYLNKLSVCKSRIDTLNLQLDKLNSISKNSLVIINKSFDKEKKEIDQFKEIIFEVVTINKELLSEMYNVSNISNTNELDTIITTVKNLHYFYNGTPDAEDINDFLYEIEAIKDSCERIYLAKESEKALDAEYRKNLDLLAQKIEDNVLDYNLILKSFYFDCMKELENKSLIFVNRIKERSKNATNIEQWVSISEDIKKKPMYIFDNDISKLQKIDITIKEKLSKKQVDYILSLINGLDQKGKNKLIDLLKENFNL
jgi:hypothetical protein